MDEHKKKFSDSLAVHVDAGMSLTFKWMNIKQFIISLINEVICHDF